MDRLRPSSILGNFEPSLNLDTFSVSYVSYRYHIAIWEDNTALRSDLRPMFDLVMGIMVREDLM